VLKLKITIGADSIDVEGDVPLAELLPLVKDWLQALPAASQRQIDQLTARIAAANTKLAGDVGAATPA